jgi:hypothetical protein
MHIHAHYPMHIEEVQQLINFLATTDIYCIPYTHTRVYAQLVVLSYSTSSIFRTEIYKTNLIVDSLWIVQMHTISAFTFHNL